MTDLREAPAERGLGDSAADTEAFERILSRATGRPADKPWWTWRRFLQAHATVTRKLEAELLAEQQLSLADFDVLIQLAAAREGSMRMSDLADRVVLSRSGMTRRIDRLEADGLVRRESCPSDRRGALAVITPAGEERLERAMPIHFRGVEEHFLSRLEADDLETLRHLLRRLLDGRTDRS